MEVVIDGILYVPAKSVLANREVLQRKIIEMWWGDVSNHDQKWLDERSKYLRIWVGDVDYDDDDLTVEQFLDNLVK